MLRPSMGFLSEQTPPPAESLNVNVCIRALNVMHTYVLSNRNDHVSNKVYSLSLIHI